MSSKRKQSAHLLDLIRALNIDPDLGLDYVVRQVASIVDGARYAGDLEELAKRYGLHYLQTKRMRRRELAQWIKENHPAVKECRKRRSSEQERP